MLSLPLRVFENLKKLWCTVGAGVFQERCALKTAHSKRQLTRRGEGGGGGGAKYARDRRLLQSYTVRGSQLTPGRSYWELLLRALTGKGTGPIAFHGPFTPRCSGKATALHATLDRKTLEWLRSQKAKISNTINYTWLETNCSEKFLFEMWNGNGNGFFMTLGQINQVTALSPVFEPLLTQAFASQYQQLTWVRLSVEL